MTLPIAKPMTAEMTRTIIANFCFDSVRGVTLERLPLLYRTAIFRLFLILNIAKAKVHFQENIFKIRQRWFRNAFLCKSRPGSLSTKFSKGEDHKSSNGSHRTSPQFRAVNSAHNRQEKTILFIFFVSLACVSATTSFLEPSMAKESVPLSKAG